MTLLANNKLRMVRMSQGDLRDTFHVSRVTIFVRWRTFSASC